MERNEPDKRTLRRWRAQGGPVDDPKALALWCIAHGKRTSPPRPAAPADGAGGDGAGVDATDPGETVPSVDALVATLGLLGAAERLRKLELFHFQRLKEAEQNGDGLEAVLRSRLHNEACDMLRTVERSVFDLEVAQGRYLLASDVARDVFRINSQTKSLLIGKLVNELPPVLEGLPAGEIQVRCRAAVREVCEMLSNDAPVPTSASSAPAADGSTFGDERGEA